MADYSALFEQAGKQFNVDPKLIAAVVQNESSGNPNAVSPQGAEGLGQLMPATAKSVGVTNPKDPKQNIFGTAQVLAQNLDHYGNVDDAIRAYHGGWDQKNWGPKTEAYHAKVTSTYGSAKPVSDAGQDVYAMWGVSPASKDNGMAPAHDQDPYVFWGANSSPVSVPPSKQTSLLPETLDQKGKEVLAGRDPVGHGIVQGVQDVISSLDPAAQWLQGHLGTITLGGLLPTAEQAHTNSVAAKNAFEKQYGKSLPATAGRIGGNILATAPVMGLAGKGVNALAEGAKAIVPAVAPLADFVAGAPQAGMLARYAQGGLQGAAQGGLGAALLSSQANAPVGQQIQQGAEFGGVLGAAAPAIYDAGRFTGNAIRHFVAPYTEAGRNQLAEHIIQDFAGGHPVQTNPGQIVPGSEPTMAEVTRNGDIANLQRSMRDLIPGQFDARAQQNAMARNALIDQTTGAESDLKSAIAARDKVADTQRNALFANAVPADVQPVADEIQNILSGPSGKRPSVQKSMTDVGNMLSDNGNAITDPETLYNSVRKGIGDLLDKTDMSKSYGKQAANQLLDVQDKLDDAIESAAPGFKNYLADYADASKSVDAMQYLQGKNLTDANGDISLSKVQSAIRDLKSKQTAAGINKAKGVSSDQLAALRAVRDDLIRQSRGMNAGKSIGSNSLQNAAAQASLNRLLPGHAGAFAQGIAEQIPQGLGMTIGGLAGNAVAGPVGGIAGAAVGNGIGKVYQRSQQANNAAILGKVANLLLNPQLYTGMTPAPLAIERAVNSPAARAVIPLAIPAALSTNRLFGNAVPAQ